MTATSPRTTLEPEASVTRPERAAAYTLEDVAIVERIRDHLECWHADHPYSLLYRSALAVFDGLRRDGFQIVERK
jgi:hypothetical protein